MYFEVHKWEEQVTPLFLHAARLEKIVLAYVVKSSLPSQICQVWAAVVVSDLPVLQGLLQPLHHWSG